MSWILDFVYGLAAHQAKKVMAWWRRSVAATVLLVFCGLAAFSGLGFIAVGSYISLSESLAPWKAGVIIGVVAILLSLIGGLIVWLAMLRKSLSRPVGAKQAPSEENDVDAVTHLGETIGASLFKNGIRTTDIMVAALVAGTVLGASPALRDRLLRRRRGSAERPSSKSYHRKTN